MGIKHILLAATLGLYAPICFGLAISGTPSGVSAYDPPNTVTPGTTPGGTTTPSTNPIIYGGTAGDIANCNGTNNSTTCDNCTTQSVAACNTTRIYPTLQMVIPLTDFGSTGVARLKIDTITTPVDLGNSLSSVTVDWGTICSRIPSGAQDCSVDGTVTGTIWIDQDYNQQQNGNEPQMTVMFTVMGANASSTGLNACDPSNSQDGLCFFRAYPGDQKIYVTEPESSGSFPTSSSRKYSKLRFFLSSSDILTWETALPGTADHVIDLNLDSSGNLSDRRIRGLENGVKYFIRVGTVDKANNVDGITSDANINSAAADCGAGPPWPVPTPGSMNCAYYAKPDEVLGLLSEDLNCFIATAAYGSQTEQYLDLLREFRFKKLVPTEWGRNFIYQYYKYGPYAAKFITEHSWLKPMARIAIWPAISFSWLVLHYGWSAAIAIYLTSIIAMIALIKIAIRKIRQQGTVRAQ